MKIKPVFAALQLGLLFGCICIDALLGAHWYLAEPVVMAYR